MSRYRVIALGTETAETVRATLRSPQYGHPAHVETAAGFGPCRYCLGTFREGSENRILFTHNSFSGTRMTPQPGPVFIHQDACRRYDGDGFPPELLKLELLFEGFDHVGRVIESDTPQPGGAEDAVTRILSVRRVVFINIRNARAGCFVARIERAPEAG